MFREIIFTSHAIEYLAAVECTVSTTPTFSVLLLAFSLAQVCIYELESRTNRELLMINDVCINMQDIF